MTDYYSQAIVSPNLPAALFTDVDIETMEGAFGLTCEREDEMLYFFADTAFSGQGENERGDMLSLTELLQTKLRLLDEAQYPAIQIQGCYSCSEMWPDEFGGFAYYITRGEVKYVFTAAWLYEQESRHGHNESTGNASDVLIAAIAACGPSAETSKTEA